MTRYLFVILGVLCFVPQLSAAPIGVPGATEGVDQSSVGLELNFLLDRDLDKSGDTEGMSVLVKGQVGVTKRVDLVYRFGFGRFENGNRDSDTGPAFGLGTKVTWAAIPDLNLKIGSVAQALQIRADVGGARQSFTEYDIALGAYHDTSGASPAPGGKALLTTYGGIAVSGVDLEATQITKEDNSIGLFAGLLMQLSRKTEAGLELRLLDQTQLSLYAAFRF